MNLNNLNNHINPSTGMPMGQPQGGSARQFMHHSMKSAPLPPLSSQFVQGYPPNAAPAMPMAQMPPHQIPQPPSVPSPTAYAGSPYHTHASPQGIPSTPPGQLQLQQQQQQQQQRYDGQQENIVLPPITSAAFARPVVAPSALSDTDNQGQQPAIKDEIMSPPATKTAKRPYKEPKRGGATATPAKSKKRRSLSCQTCRKLKTRCDFDSTRGMCHRCFVLRLSCSLTTEHVQQPNYLTKVDLTIESDQQAEPPAAQPTAAPAEPEQEDGVSPVQTRLDSLETAISNISTQLLGMRNLLEAVATHAAPTHIAAPPPPVVEQTSEHEILDKATNKAPLVVIRDIDYKLFERLDKYATMRTASQDLGHWTVENVSQELRVKLTDCFFSKCAPYTITDSPAKSLHDDPQTNPSLLMGVLMLQGMRCDSECTHDILQPQLFAIVRSLMGTALMTSPLQLSDIEALMYVAAFNIARKPVQPIFDSWLLTSYAVKLFILSVSFFEFIERASQGMSTPEDLYALRLWNSICLVHYQYAILTGRPVLIPKQYLDQCSLIFRIPGNTMNDAIVLAEVRLYQALVTSQAQQSMRHLTMWKEQHIHEYEADRQLSRNLSIGYEFCLIVFARKYGDVDANTASGSGNGGARESSASPTPHTPETMRGVAIESSVNILNCILDLPPSRISGMPNHPLCVLIYAVMTLCDYFQYTPASVNSLSLIVRTYWYLCHMGEQSRDIINSIARIIKSIIQSARKGATDLFPARARTTNSAMASPEAHIKDDPQAYSLSSPIQAHMPEGDGTEPVFEMPDITQYATFDDFFDGVFSYVHNYTNLIST